MIFARVGKIFRWIRPVLETSYPLIVYGLVLIGFVITNLVLAQVAGPRKRTATKEMPYESGMDPIGDARQRFDVRYYLVAIVFLLFDVELLFLYPWAVAQWSAGPTVAVAAAVPDAEVGAPAVLATVLTGIPPVFRNLVFGEILVFVAILAAAFAYAWRKGVFEWR
jgi:NADH-quinone oxidoreductase subunit A